jgi:hypothetical protein
MNLIAKIKNFILYPYYKYKEYKFIKQRTKELQKRDPFIYK